MIILLSQVYYSDSKSVRATERFGEWNHFLCHSLRRCFCLDLDLSIGYGKTFQANISHINPDRLFELSKASRHINTDFFILILATIVSIATVYPYCFWSSNICLRFQAIGNTAYESNWYKISPKMQKNVLFMMAYAQRPRYFTGYGMFNCSLEIFRRVW